MLEELLNHFTYFVHHKPRLMPSNYFVFPFSIFPYLHSYTHFSIICTKAIQIWGKKTVTKLILAWIVGIFWTMSIKQFIHSKEMQKRKKNKIKLGYLTTFNDSTFTWFRSTSENLFNLQKFFRALPILEILCSHPLNKI